MSAITELNFENNAYEFNDSSLDSLLGIDEFDSSSSYIIGSYVKHTENDGHRYWYKCIKDFSGGSWSSSVENEYFEKLDIEKFAQSILGVTDIQYDPSANYYVNNYTIHDGILYRCIDAVSAGGDWDLVSESFTQTSIINELENSGGGSADALLKTTFIPEFSDTDKYVPGQLVYHNGTAYECINVHEGAWDDNDFGWAWDEAFFKQLLITNFVTPYSESTTYNKGDYTMLSNQLVRFNEDWDPNDPNSNFNVSKINIKEALTQQVSVGSLLGIQPYTSAPYDKYAMVLYSGDIYYSEVDNNTKSPYEGDWSSISYRTLLLIKYINENFNYSAFVDNKQYYKNDIVEKNGTLFKFNQNYSGSWDESKVDLYPDYNGSETLNQFYTLMFNKKVLESNTKIANFDPDVSYEAGTLVYNYNRLILKLESAYTANTPSSFNATEATFEEIITYISSGVSLSQLFEEYSTSKRYYIGNIVTYDNKIYRFHKNKTSTGDFDATYVTEISLSDNYVNDSSEFDSFIGGVYGYNEDFELTTNVYKGRQIYQVLATLVFYTKDSNDVYTILSKNTAGAIYPIKITETFCNVKIQDTRFYKLYNQTLSKWFEFYVTVEVSRKNNSNINVNISIDNLTEPNNYDIMIGKESGTTRDNTVTLVAI